jgi:hypothetical protein
MQKSARLHNDSGNGWHYGKSEVFIINFAGFALHLFHYWYIMHTNINKGNIW